jgi:pre-rRNA-processing protein TSR4
MAQHSTVWLGVPDGHLTGAADAYVSRIGGRPSWLRAPATKVACTRCGGAMDLLAQLHAPLAVFDRILYVFCCLACGGKGVGSATVLRSQVYNSDYDEEYQRQLTATNAKPQERLFEVNAAEADDWGDDEPAPKPAAAPAAPQPPALRYSWVPDLAPAENDVAKAKLVCYYLETVPEPREQKQELTEDDADDAIISRLENQAPGTFDQSAGADDAEDEDATADEFVQRLARAPRQCVRWQPGGEPLVALCNAPRGPVAPCSLCGKARVFECQVMSPAIFFATEGVPEAEQPLHFSTILVFTCSANCYAKDVPAATEVAIWHDEI